jgi:hypothetical protein
MYPTCTPVATVSAGPFTRYAAPLPIANAPMNEATPAALLNFILLPLKLLVLLLIL